MPAKKLYTVSEQLNETIIFTLDNESYSHIKPEQYFDIRYQIKTYIAAYEARVPQPEGKKFKFIIQYPNGLLTDKEGRNAELVPARVICQFMVTEENGKLSQEIVIPENTCQARLALNTFYAYNIGEKKITGAGASSTIKQYQEEKDKLDVARSTRGWLLFLLGAALLVAGIIIFALSFGAPLGLMAIPAVLGVALGPPLMIGGSFFLLTSSEKDYRDSYFKLSSFFSSSVDQPTYVPEVTTPMALAPSANIEVSSTSGPVVNPPASVLASTPISTSPSDPKLKGR